MARHRGVSRASKRDGGKPKRGCRDVHISFRCPSKIVTRSVELMRGHASSCAAGHWGVGSLFGVIYAWLWGPRLDFRRVLASMHPCVLCVCTSAF
jgi:hypothetical protein